MEKKAGEMPDIQLREHQVYATSGIRKWVGFPARSSVPPEGARGTGVSATGSGKTITAAWAALENFRDDRILVMVPTLDLLVQTIQVWRRIGHRSLMVAVCSLENDPVLNELGVRTTTNPIQLALWAGHGPVVVFATYASLVDREDPEDPSQRKVRGPLEAALAGGDRLYGQRMDPFDFAVVDEAHGTAGDLGRPWSAIHDNARIPIAFRLYLTATPRILASPRLQMGTDGQELEIASMGQNSQTYGPWLFELGLSEAIEREILAGFEIDVLEIRDPSPSPVPGGSEEAQRGRRLALLQTALLEHAARWNLKTVMTFHQRVEEAEAFAAKLPETAAELYVTEASDGALADAERLPTSSIDAELYDLEAGRHVPPDRVWSAWLCGDHLVTERRETIRQFANGIDADGKRVHRAFLASVRVLGEGVDIVGIRGVQAICFADTRGSQVEIVQNIGRALRPNPDGTTKTARIIVPIFLEPGENPDDMVASASFRPLVAVLQGLRSHDERLVEQLASRALTRSKQQRKIHVQRDQEGRIVGADGEDQEHDDDTQAAAESALLHFSSPRDAATIAAFLRTRVYRPDSLVWLEGYQALVRWRAENEITGVYAVPYDTETEVGVTKDFPLGHWVHQQRKALRAGELEERRKELLDAPEAGMVWEPGEEAWENKIAALRSYHRATGHLAPRQDAVWGEGDAMVPVGQHMANLRRKGQKNGLGKAPERAAERAAQLTAIDPDWDCPWPLDWQRHYRVLTDLVDADGTLPDIAPGVLMDGDDIGKWLARQREASAWAQLSAEQQERLSQLGVQPLQTPSPAPAAKLTKGPSKAEQAFQRGLAALTQWVEREGTHRPVPRGHSEQITVDGETEPVTVKLGVWISNTKTRRDKLTPEQRTALQELGVPWT